VFVVKDRLTVLVMTVLIIPVGQASKSHDALEEYLIMVLTSSGVTVSK
jgi:hypothetical protein